MSAFGDISEAADKGYRILLADPPWSFETHDKRSRTPTQKVFAEDDDHYPTMILSAMKALPIDRISAPHSVLLMWVVGSHLADAIDLGRAWGFTYKTDVFYWLKQKMIDADQLDMFTGDIAPPRISMGYYSRKQVEPVLLFTKGKGVPRRSKGVRQVIIEPIREHSRKPDTQYDRISELFGPPTDVPCIELFARTTRSGWDTWGNETSKFETAT